MLFFFLKHFFLFREDLQRLSYFDLGAFRVGLLVVAAGLRASPGRC